MACLGMVTFPGSLTAGLLTVPWCATAGVRRTERGFNMRRAALGPGPGLTNNDNVHQFLKLENIKAFCPGARDPKGVLKRLAKQNETLNVLNCKLTSSKEVQIKKGEVETSKL